LAQARERKAKKLEKNWMRSAIRNTRNNLTIPLVGLQIRLEFFLERFA
jgi:hypothetical protein